MKALKSMILLLSAAVLWFSTSFGNVALAADGAAIFTAKCAQCHMGGKNIINPSKTLSLTDLKANGKDTVDAIATQVTNGKAPMPAFKGLLSDAEITAVAEYVLAQAEAGW